METKEISKPFLLNYPGGFLRVGSRGGLPMCLIRGDV